jgi:hypothetical protein
LSEWVKNGHALNINTYLKGIKNGIKHLYKLELIHYNINSTNIIINREESIIINFDSCRPMGERLGLKAGMKGWIREDLTSAQQEIDDDGILKI